MSYNSDLQDAINKINSITSTINLSGMLEQYEKAYKPITQTAGMLELINQATSISAIAMHANQTSVYNLIATSNSALALAASIQDSALSKISFPSATLNAVEALQTITSNISFDENVVRMSTDAQRFLDSMPLSYDKVNTTSENLDTSTPKQEENTNVSLAEQTQATPKTIQIPNKDFARKYAIKFIMIVLQIILDIYVANLTSDAPAIINAIQENTQRIETDFEKIIDTINESHTEDIEIRNREIEIINEQNRLLQIIADSLAAPQSASEHSEELPHPSGSENP